MDDTSIITVYGTLNYMNYTLRDLDQMIYKLIIQ